MFRLTAYPKTYEQYRLWRILPSGEDSNVTYLRFFKSGGYSIPSDPRDESGYYELKYQGQVLAKGHFDPNRSIDETDEMILEVFAKHYESH